MSGDVIELDDLQDILEKGFSVQSASASEWSLEATSGKYAGYTVTLKGTGLGDTGIFPDAGGTITGVVITDSSAAATEFTGLSLSVADLIDEIDLAGDDHSLDLEGTDGDDDLDGGGHDDTLSGGDGDDHVFGHGGDDDVSGGDGDDVLKGGKGKDTFVFTGDFGDNVVKGFDSRDQLQFDKALFDDFAALKSAMSAFKGGTLIEAGDNSVLLDHVKTAKLDAGDFLFV